MRRVIVPSLCLSLLAAGCHSADPPSAAGGASSLQDLKQQEQADERAARIDDDGDGTDAGAVLRVIFAPVILTTDVIGGAFRAAEGDTPASAVRMTLDNSSPDNRRVGVYKLVEYPFARRPPYTTRYEQMAQGDSDPTVRAAALRACNRARDRRAVPVFIAGLSDPSELVRLEAAKGLANVPDSSAVPALLKVAANVEENRDVRVAAADAVKYYRSLEVARSLCVLLTDREFAVAWQARRSLVHLTGRNFGYDDAAWLGYFAGPQRPLG